MTSKLTDVIAGAFTDHGLSRHSDLAPGIVRALEAAGLPVAALEGVMNQTHVVVPKSALGALIDAHSALSDAAAPPSPDAKDADHG